KAAQVLLVEDLRDEAHVAEHREAPVVRDRDPGRLLAAVLLREEAEVRDPRDVTPRGTDAEHAAHQRTLPIVVSPREPRAATSSGAHARMAALPIGPSGSSTDARLPLH